MTAGLRHRVMVFAVLAALLAAAFASGCLDAVKEKRAEVSRVLQEAGPVEDGTIATWLVGKGEREDEIIASPRGQWAVSATASSYFGGTRGNPGYTPKEATGAPNSWESWVDPKAWGPATENAGLEWIELDYEDAVHAQGVRVRELSGWCIVMVQLKDTDGNYHAVWKGHEKSRRDTTWLLLVFPEKKYLTRTVRVTLDTTRTAEWWKQIDSVQLVGPWPGS